MSLLEFKKVGRIKHESGSVDFFGGGYLHMEAKPTTKMLQIQLRDKGGGRFTALAEDMKKNSSFRGKT